MIIFSIVTTLTAGSLAKVCVPSQVTLLLKLRSGVIPTFRDRNFASYRQVTDAVTKIGGSLFWGSILASLFIGGIFALLSFLILWEQSRDLVLKITATVIGKFSYVCIYFCMLTIFFHLVTFVFFLLGIGTTLLFREVSLLIFRRNTYNVYYR